jgi:hypothetical protein
MSPENLDAFWALTGPERAAAARRGELTTEMVFAWSLEAPDDYDTHAPDFIVVRAPDRS